MLFSDKPDWCLNYPLSVMASYKTINELDNWVCIELVKYVNQSLNKLGFETGYSMLIKYPSNSYSRAKNIRKSAISNLSQSRGASIINVAKQTTFYFLHNIL